MGTAAPITLVESGPPSSYTAEASLPRPAFSSGANIEMQAIGASVPAFEGTFTAPAPLEGYVAPSSVSRSGMTVTWTSVPGTTLQLTLVGTGSTQMSPYVRCEVADTGSLTVPAAVFAWMPGNFPAITLDVARAAELDVEVPHGVIHLQVLDGTSTTSIPLGP
jgi:hypothetical protein